MDPLFFETPGAFRAWLDTHHDSLTEQWIGYYKKATGIPSMNWSESVDEALCYGWIDGLRKRIDEQAYMIRFTPRKPKSHWSDVNLKKVQALIKEGRMQPAGLKIWEIRDEKRSRQASYERKAAQLSPEFEKMIRDNPKAWVYFSEKLSPTYRKQTVHWVMGAKKEETRLRRMKTLIECSAEGRMIPPMKWAK